MRYGAVASECRIEPGDLLLFSPVKPNLTARSIHHVQRELGNVGAHAYWTHAAIATVEGHLVEADFPVTAYRVLGPRFIHSFVRVRRAKLNREERQRIALYAMSMHGQRYPLERVIARAVEVPLNAFGNLSFVRLSGRAVVCSQLVEVAFQRVARRSLGGGFPEFTYPADLSTTGEFKDISMQWNALPVA